ncbi:MAG: ribokinase [Bryobacteraceae bacterium]|nr:MAG: ribokinase [Bryobacteraceae bacterium]
MPQRTILVIGSLNMDFVVQVDRLPAPGETARGENFRMIPGGKGANQACAAARLARDRPVRMIGRVGFDSFADHLRASLAAAGVDPSGIHGCRAAPTGVALIWVDRTGQNSIVIAPGANDELSRADLETERTAFVSAACALFQLETPLETVTAGLRLAADAGALSILDPAPARPLPPDVLGGAGLLTPNETEACLLAGLAPQRIGIADAPALAAALRARGARAVVLKLGDQGCFYSGPGGELHAPAFSVEAVDATAAGDTFNAALAVALSEGMPLAEALRFANAAAALSVTRLGAQTSIPTREEVERFLAERIS